MATTKTKQIRPKKPAATLPGSVGHITDSIWVLRGHKVLLDSDLAALYGVTTKVLNQAVKRNAERFPPDFMFRLSNTEVDDLNRSQIVTGSQKHRDPRFPPYVFTEHGAIMAATLLNSPRAVEMSIYVVRAFVQLRELIASNQELAQQLKSLEARMTRKFAAHDHAITDIIKTIRQLMSAPPMPKRSIGFVELQERKK